jgi:hypothetical protein
MEPRPRSRASLRIDPDNLNEELVRQPELFCDVARRYALAVSERDAAKEQVSVARAKAYFVVREELESEGLKTTESAIGIQIELNKDYRSAMDRFQETKLAADQLAADKEAWQQRAYMLKDLAALYIAGYYGQSSVRGDASRAVQEADYQENRQRLARQRRRIGDE